MGCSPTTNSRIFACDRTYDLLTGTMFQYLWTKSLNFNDCFIKIRKRIGRTTWNWSVAVDPDTRDLNLFARYFIRDPRPRPSLWVVAARMSDRRGGLSIFERFAGEKGEESSLRSIILAHMTYYTLSLFNLFVLGRLRPLRGCQV
jgi:hypothetical protein